VTLKEPTDYIHSWAHRKGFYAGRHRPDRACEHRSGSRAAAVMLIVTELAEAVEADRRGDDDNFDEELADATIRILDLCGAEGIDLEAAITDKMIINECRQRRHGKRY